MESNSTITSNEEDYSTGKFWAMDLEIGTRDEHSTGTLLPMAMSGAELMMDALQAHRNQYISETFSVLKLYATENLTAEQTRKHFVDSDIVRNLHAIRAIDFYLDMISANIAASHRETGNTFRKKEVQNEK